MTPERSGKPKSYVLGMFPYPSGEGLHTGHGRIFTAVDVVARYQRMKGYDVLCPMGWDAFGLPAENAAIKARKNPVDMVPHNEANFKRQMMMLGWSYDWDRAFSTTDPAYYKWTAVAILESFIRRKPSFTQRAHAGKQQGGDDHIDSAAGWVVHWHGTTAWQDRTRRTMSKHPSTPSPVATASCRAS